jgi:hypothetical protein
MIRHVRQSQTITPFGVGAIIDINGESFVLAATEEWPKAVPVQSKRLSLALDADFRSAPAVDGDRFHSGGPGLPFARFPTWLFCKHCRRMTHRRRQDEQVEPTPTCKYCKTRLVPMRIVQVCEHGHLDDVNWEQFAHSTPGSRGCSSPDLRFDVDQSSGTTGLESLVVKCDTCSGRRNLGHITEPEFLSKQLKSFCRGRNPWSWVGEDCDAPPRAVQRGASNVYYPSVWSSIEVPSDDEEIGVSEGSDAVRASDYFTAACGAVKSGNEKMASMLIAGIASDTSTSELFVRSVVNAALAGSATTTPSVDRASLVSGEWVAFDAPQGMDTGEFISRPEPLVGPDATAAEAALDRLIGHVVLVERLREVRAFEGFHRVSPDDLENMIRSDGRRRDQPAKFGKLWHPAIEVFGEGIFLSLDDERVREWEADPGVQRRVDVLASLLEPPKMAPRFEHLVGSRLLPRFVLVHTLAHLMIRRLAFESGYGATALRDRIYGQNGPASMCGLLVYTSSGDAEGTMGGLVRRGRRPDLARTLLETLADAAWCSSDPLCGEQWHSGSVGLSHAACHACTLVPETSCECGNHLLDRVLLIGGEGVPGFFEGVIDLTLEQAVAVNST